MAATTPAGTTPYYFIPSPSRFPAQTALGLFFVILGAGQWVNGVDWGAYALLLGLALWVNLNRLDLLCVDVLLGEVVRHHFNLQPICCPK